MQKVTVQKKQSNLPSESKKWTVALLFAVTAGLFFAVYVYFLTGTLNTVEAWSMVTAGIAGVLLASSLSASSFSYYIKWPKMQWGYQKQLGLLAFWLCLLYCIELLFIYPETYYYGFWDNLYTADLVFGLGAMFIFGIMTVANFGPVKHILGWDIVKFILGLGFFGYALLVIRAIFLEWHIWEVWFVTMDGLPTTRFVLSVLAVAVLLLRISIPLSKRKGK